MKKHFNSVVQMFLESIILFVYIIFFDAISLGIMMITDTFWKIFLLIVALLFFATICFPLGKTSGEKSYKLRHNALLRKERGDLKYNDNFAKEYRPYKGFVIGAFSCVTMVILIILYAITGNDIFSGIVFLGFSLFSSIIKTISVDASVYFTLWGILYVAACYGIPYIYGGLRVQSQYNKIQRQQEEIYGKKEN